MGGTVAAGAAGAAAGAGFGAAVGATSTVTPAPASRTLHSSAPTLTFIHSSLCSPLALTFIHPSIHPSILVLTPCPHPHPHPHLSGPALACMGPIVHMSVCTHALWWLTDSTCL